ncbi:hypothetical protein [Sinorhizobium meliloti]|jgi:hypothetical protein|uniref:hypothetical protein n=1 Tax=Rhizobium meliloti TaxID=382 RepID=UPI000FD6C2F3|nr:hypothetical protein [Sinorhizobium meliloti]RVK27336.1 hypothetical protein CN163_30955 [Sinorhizobium meliloti]
MADRATWTASRARDEFDHLLDEAKNKGPQQITDVRGTFTLRFNPERAAESITEFLSKGLPDSSSH